jgi:hypothetical protein
MDRRYITLRFSITLPRDLWTKARSDKNAKNTTLYVEEEEETHK